MSIETPVMKEKKVPVKALEGHSVDAVAKYIKENDVRKIVVMTGAGISTSAGIPDFRSPNTGIYSNLGRLNLPNPEAVFDISYFRKDPHPFYALAREMFPGRYRPTITHSFIKLLHDKGRLLKLFTQNIDCLEREAGVPGEMIVEAHGSFATHSCIECKVAYPDDLMRKAIDANDIPLCPECMGLVKPDIVFFGEWLPPSFFLNRTLPAEADLCIVMGTSLTVQPFASLPSLCREEVPRVLVNLEKAGAMGSRPDDVLILGDCDKGVRRLAEALGWLDDLEELWGQTNPEKAKLNEEDKKEKEPVTQDEQLREEVDRLTEEVEATLNISQDHDEQTRAQLKDISEKEERRDQDKTPNEENANLNEKTPKPEAIDEKANVTPITEEVEEIKPVETGTDSGQKNEEPNDEKPSSSSTP